MTTDRDARTRGRLEQHWKASDRGDIGTEHAIYDADAILDYPQSGERFLGRAKIKAQRGGHPAERHFRVLRIRGAGDLWVSECVITYNGAPTYSNAAGTATTSGTVTVTDLVPGGLTLTSMPGTGWTCSANTCSRSDPLAAGGATAQFPNGDGLKENYWVDVVLLTSSP